MRDALLRDLGDCYVEIITTIDVRVKNDALQTNIHAGCRAVDLNDDVWQVWGSLIKQCDAVWAIAPETDGLLKKLAELTQKLGKVWLGCGLDAIEIFGDKRKTHTFLQQHKASTPTFSWQAFLDYAAENPNKLFNPLLNNRYVAKPIFGAGCEDTFVFDSWQNLTEFMQQNRQNSHLIQLFLAGQPASFCALFRNGKAWLLSVNSQQVIESNGKLSFNGVTVNGIANNRAIFARIASDLASWQPSLNGIIGVDLMIADDSISIIEVNPRLTTSYAGLAASIGHNPAQVLLDCWQNDHFELPMLTQKEVAIVI